MIKFFRKIRRKLLAQGKLASYASYAIGEILLVVIGILLALSISNWNERQKDKTRLTQYRLKMISELHADLAFIDSLNARIQRNREAIAIYVNALSADPLNMEGVTQNLDLMQRVNVSAFTKSSHTLDELKTSGSISLFSEKEKQAITKLMSTQEIYQYYERFTVEGAEEKWAKYKDKVDYLFELGIKSFESNAVKGWRFDLDSEQYLKYNNLLAVFLETYDYQQNVVYRVLRRDINSLLKILNENSSLN